MKRKQNITLFEYIWVAEYQQRGAIHYHLIIVTDGYLKHPDETPYWRPRGKSNRKEIKVHDLIRTGRYLAKYLTKQSEDTDKARPRRVWGRSRFSAWRYVTLPRIYWNLGKRFPFKRLKSGFMFFIEDGVKLTTRTIASYFDQQVTIHGIDARLIIGDSVKPLNGIWYPP